ncbi:DUF5801 repeats-in-toxin domain-containing protein [Neorhizobium galegae]|uniref:T1SS-143 repeat domain-containing protein n=1 Tax=Neorhizobium galegae TaxID=399 RepID=UPI001F47AC87|nr:DUF5801 repeats-in-toxin domain-containing protein [Neorhizobium galegae]UIK04593.1 DUF5801 domain-containing protein [Neorhizobium galegae]
MSVEDPRLSNISEENLTENFSSEIQEEIAASSTPSPIEHEIQVAQAGDGRTPTTNRVPTDPNAPAAAPAAPAAEVTPDANNIVHLATSVSIDDIRVDGANLILVQADGTEIVIVNGATKIPTMLIGEVEVPQQVLFAALEDSGINVAAGPDGSFSATGRPDSSGAEFDDSIQGSQNDPIQLASLLGDTEFGDGGGLDDRTAADDQPDAFDMGSPFIFSESVLADDVVGNETITGVLAFDGGDDFGIVSSVNYQSTSDMAEGTGSGVAAPLTSGGQAVTVSTSADGLTVTGTITVGETTVTVFTLTVTNPTTGAFTYTQSQPLDHPDLGEIGADDALRLNFTFTVTDKDGDSDTGSFSIEIGDDGPVQREAGSASLNEDDVSAYPATDGSEAARKTGDISLGISWGADADTRNGEGDTFGRSVGFANAAGAVPANAEGVYTGAADVGLSVTGGTLTSGGSELYYVITDLGNGGQTLTAYVDGSEPAAKVFEISLDPTSANGSYTVEIFQELDHSSDSDALTISFQFQGVDADGDAAASGTALITIADDASVIGAAGEGKVDEGGGKTAHSSLGISWGADDGNTSIDGGYSGTQDAGDRSVVFTPGAVSDLPPADGGDMPALKAVDSSVLSTAAVSAFMRVSSGEIEIALGDLSSGGQSLVYTLSTDGRVLTAADQEGGPVFTVTLSDTGAGGYTFELQGVLDHPGHGETGSETDILTFEFTYTVRDGDGDVAESTFTVDVKDDVPVATGSAVEIRSDEDDISNLLSSGTHPDDGTADGSTSTPSLIGFGDAATVSGSIASVVAFGADGAAAGGGFGFVADAAAKMQALALTSKGGTLSYAMVGDALVAFVNVAGGAGFGWGDRPVFSLTLDHVTGAFTYQQYDQLDHVAGNGENTALKSGSGSIAAIDFGAVIQATDGDGDHVGLGGKFSITITDDVPAPSIIATGASTTIDETVNNQSNDTDNQAVRSLFAAVANVGHDADMGNAAIFARNGFSLVTTISSEPGADETTTKVLSLEIASVGVDSGLATTGGKSIFLFEEGGLIVGRFDSDGNGTPDAAAFAVAIDQSGRVSVAQYVSLHQGDTATSNETVTLGDKISAVVTATDYDGDVVRDTVSIGSHIRFADDGPLASGAKVSATADEDDISNLLSSGTHPDDGTADGSTSTPSLIGFGDAATVSGSIASVVAFGADGAAAGGGFGFVADAAAKMQALALTSKGGTLSYAMVGDALVAFVNVAGGAGFGWGDRPVFSLTLDHVTGAFTYQQYDQLDHVAGNGENTALKSGSGSIAAIDFGAVIQATDGDGDHVGLGGKFSITITDDVPEIAIFTDETVTIDETSGFQNDDSGAGSIGSLFAGVGNRGVDADLGGPIYARDDVIDISVENGADDNVSTALTLRVDGGNGIDSGLLTTEGAHIYLYLEAGVVVGRVGGANGLAAFAIAIDGDGRVSVAEYLSLKHPSNASSDEGVNLSGKISAVLTATDYDGDVVTKSVSIGDKIAFEDDGPSVGGNSAVWVDDDNVVGAQGNNGGTGDHALANITGELSHDFGADGGSIAWKTTGAPTGFTYVRDGDALLVKQGATTVMTITLDTATGAYSVTQNAAIDHPAGNNENDVSFNLTYTVTDGDGDHVDGTLTINADDDTPISTGVIGTGAITESATGGSIAGELSALVSPGADGVGRYSVETTGLSSSLTSLTSGGVALTYSVVGNALVAKAGAATIFTFTVDPATGHYAFAQTGPLDHTDTVVIDGASIPAAALGVVGSHAAVPDVGGNDLAFVGRMPDGDAIIRVSNDGGVARTWVLDNNAGGADYVLQIPAHTTWYVNVGNVANQTKFDLDGFGAPSGTTTVNNGHQQIAVIDGDSSLDLDLSSAVTVTDGDEDGVALNGQLIVTVADSVPTAGPNASGTVEEGGTETITAALTGLAWGADAGSARTLSFTGSVATTDQNGAPVAGLSSNGHPVTIDIINGVLTGFIGSTNPPAPGDIVFTASLNVATGAYSFSLLQPLDHTAPNATSQYLDLALGFTATDADGDAATSTVTVRVDAAGSIDSINYSNLSTSVFVNLDDAAQMVGGQAVAANTATDGASEIDKVIGLDSVSGIVDALGGAGNDVLIGGAEANKLTGNGGNDHLDGGLGADVLDGGAGNDTFVLGADVTGSGTRNIQLGDGSLLAVNIAGLAGTADKVIGGAGNDTIILERDGKSGFVADYSTAPDYLSGVEKIVGTDGNDVILLAAGSTADGGPITLEGGNGNDTLGGSNSADIINGGDGNDLISGLGGNDTLTGGNGDDEIWGGAGADTIDGGDNTDKITGGLGNDTINGGAGGDTFNYAIGDGVDTIDGGAAPDVLLTSGNATAESAVLTVTSTGLTLDVDGDGNVDVNATNIESVVLYQAEGADKITVRGQDAAETITIAGNSNLLQVYGNGIPSISGISTSELSIEGKGGNDVINASGLNASVSLTIDGGAGNDVLYGGQGLDTLAGGDGADIIIGGADNDILWGGKHADSLFGNGTSNTGSDLNAAVGEADSANYGGPANKYHVFFDTTALGGGLGIWRVQALDGAPEFTGTHVSVDTDNLYGIEKIQFNNLTLDLLAPVRLFDGNNLVGTFTTISDANAAAFAGFRIELVGTVTNQSATITKENLTVVGGAEDTGIVLTLDGVQNITLQGEAPINVIGNGLSNTINGNDGANLLEGGDGNDVLNGNGGDDSLFGGAGNDRFSGGTGINKMVGGTGNDQFFATGGTDTIHGNGEADIAATAGENDMVVYYGNQSNFAITRMLDGGWQVLNTANGEIDKLYGVESINFNGGAIELDLTAPVQLFDGNNLVGTFTTISDANAAAFAGFRIELVGTVTNQSATITKENLTVVGGAEDTGIVLTLDGVQNITLQGEAPINVIGNGLSNTINGNDGANLLEGGDGNDVLNGNGGDDSLFGGAGNDRFGGGTGINKMVGGTGNDQFFATGGTDTIHGNGEADIAATAGENDMVVYYGNQSNFAITRMLDGGWQVLNTANGEIDKLYGVESINFNGGAIELDLTAPVQLFDGNNLVGTFTTISDANTAASAGFRIELVGTVTNQSATITKENLTVVGGTEDTGIVLTLDGVQTITLQGEAPINVIGDGLSNTINGNDGANILEGGDGNDVLNGKGGDDTIQWSVGDGLDVVDGGTEFAGGRDLLRVVGSSASEQYAIWSVAAYNAAHPGTPYAGLAEILLTVNGALAAEVNEIEDIVIQGGGGADTLAVNGSFAGTSLLTSTITYEGGEGDETFDVSELTSGHSVVVKGAGGADVLVIGDEAGESVWKDVTVTQDPATGEFTISLPNGGPVLKATGVESFRFFDGTVTAAQLIEQAPTDLTTSGLTVAENSAAGTVVGSVHGVDVNGSIDPLSYAFILADSSTSLTSADGRFVINASTGEISVAAGAVLDYETTPSIGFSVRVTDSKNGSYSETFSVQLTNVNEAPILAHPIADLSIAEEGTISFQIPGDTFSDVDSLLTYVATLGDGSALPAWLHFDPDTGTFSGKAPLDYNGPINVMVTASDGPNSASDTFNITVTPVNDAPTPHDDIFFVDEDHTTSGTNFLTNDTDVDGDTLQPTAATITSGPGGSGWLYQNGDLVYTPHANASGITTIDYTVSDGTTTASATITLNIRPVADAATISGSGLGNEDGIAAVTLNIGLGDTDGSEKVTRVELSGFPTGAIFSQGAQVGGVWVIENAAGVNTSGLTMTPPHDFAGNVTLNVAAKVLDSAMLSDGLVYEDTEISTGSISIAVNAVNDAPVITGDHALAVNEGATVAVTSQDLYFSDPDDIGTGVTFTVTATTNGSVLVNGIVATTFTAQQLADNLVSFRHDGSETTSGSFGVSLEDGNEDNSTAATATVNVAVTPVDDQINTITVTGSDTVDMTNYGKIIYSNDTLNPSGTTDAKVTNFDVVGDKISLKLAGTDVLAGAFQVITSDNTDVAAGVKIIALQYSGATVGSLSQDNDGNNVEDIIAAATKDFPGSGTYTFIVYQNTQANNAHAGIYMVQINDVTDPASGSPSSNQIIVEHVMTLNNVGYGKLTAANFVAAADPIILDLDHNGFAFTSVDDGVKFDINADGKLDQVAWTKTDGILAFDVDGNGKIDNGSEIFTPNFAGGAHAGGVAALSTLDVNHDGKIDASDTGFDKLLVWQDANGNGVSDEGELKGLNDYGITGISLDADSAEGYIDGQALFAEGSFTYADGSTGSFVEVGFDTLFSDAPDHVLVGTDGDDILAAMPGLTQMTGGTGADTFVLDPSALHELDMADIITDYKSNEGDAVDVSKLLDTLLGHQATGEEAAANVRTTIAGNDTTVSVQVATDSWKDVAVLQNHTEAVKILFDDDKHSANISHV